MCYNFGQVVHAIFLCYTPTSVHSKSAQWPLGRQCYLYGKVASGLASARLQEIGFYLIL